MPYKDPEKAKEVHRKSNALWRKNNPEKVLAQKRRWRRRKGMFPQGAPRTHCRAGHEMTPENTYVKPGHPNTRVCRTCKDLSNKRAFAKRYIPRPRPLFPPDLKKRPNGWTVGMFETTMSEQGNRCAICRLPFDRTCADHKHVQPPEPRGVLCNGCNTAIGLLKENPETCRAAAEYLEAWA